MRRLLLLVVSSIVVIVASSSAAAAFSSFRVPLVAPTLPLRPRSSRRRRSEACGDAFLSSPPTQSPSSPSSPSSSCYARAASSSTALSSAPLSIIPAVTPLQGDILRTTFGAILAHRISTSGQKRGSLSKSGALSAFVVATLSLACSARSGITLLVFYLTSSKFTALGIDKKKKLEEDHAEGGKRGAVQVLSCSAVAVAVALARRAAVGRDGPLDLVLRSITATAAGVPAVAADAAAQAAAVATLGDRLTYAYVAFFACCAGDTWASELGVLSKSPPRLITRPWKTVPPGTNGGVSKIGLVASALGGLVMGVVHGGLVLPMMLATSSSSLGTIAPFVSRETLALSIVGLLGGLGGSLLDSWLGATIQATYYDRDKGMILKDAPSNKKATAAEEQDGKSSSTPSSSERIGGGWAILSNEMVNVVSTVATALAAALLAGPLLSRIMMKA